MPGEALRSGCSASRSRPAASPAIQAWTSFMIGVGVVGPARPRSRAARQICSASGCLVETGAAARRRSRRPRGWAARRGGVQGLLDAVLGVGPGLAVGRAARATSASHGSSRSRSACPRHRRRDLRQQLGRRPAAAGRNSDLRAAGRRGPRERRDLGLRWPDPSAARTRRRRRGPAPSRAPGRHCRPGGRTWTEPNRTISEVGVLHHPDRRLGAGGRGQARAAARPASRTSCLADRAEEGRAAGLDLAVDDALAAGVAAGLALAVVGAEAVLEIAQGPVGLGEVAQGGAASLDRLASTP
jgi:hypothetical protein